MDSPNIGNLFPYLKEKKKIVNLKIDPESISFISSRQYSDKITNIILYYINELKLNSKNMTITDATAGVGGDTISFAKYFSFVNAIEIDELRYNYLKNNLDVFELNNVVLYNKDCTDCIYEIDSQDIIFIDPPWGGKSYKKYAQLLLTIGNHSLEDFCNKLMNKAIMKKVPKIIVLKLPANYNIKKFYESIDKQHSVFLHDLKKMLILVVIVNN